MKKNNLIEGSEVIKKNTVNNDNKKSKTTNRILIAIIIFLVLFIFVVTYLLVFGSNLFESLKGKVPNKDDIQLNYTEVVDSNSDGIYITDVSDIVENVMPSIVAITSKTLISTGNYGPWFEWNNQSQYTEGAGSGIIISKSDDKLYILTNNHVVEGSSELIVQFINEKSVDATIVGTSERKDLAIISIPLSDLDDDTIDSIKIATIGSSDELKVGNGIIAIGNALGYGQSVTTGVVSALNREVTIDDYTYKMIQIDAAINGGNSGGALLNSKGEVVGINSAKYSSSGTYSSASIEGMGFAIPISDVEDLIVDLMNGEEDSNGVTIGIEGYMTNTGINYNFPLGFYISSILPDGNAANSDLEIGQIITKIDGEEIESFIDLSNALYEKSIGDSATLTVKYIDGNHYSEKEVVIKFEK